MAKKPYRTKTNDNRKTPPPALPIVPSKRAGGGRPSIYTDELAEKICRYVGRGDPLYKIVQWKTMPSHETIYSWLSDGKHLTFSENFARARKMQAEILAEQTVEIADSASDARLASVRIDARRWLAGKWDARRFGDVVRREVTGAEGGPVTVVTLSPLSEIESRLAGLSARLIDLTPNEKSPALADQPPAKGSEVSE